MVRFTRTNDGKVVTATVYDDATFNEYLSAGEYDVTVTALPKGYSVKSIKVGNRDLRATKLPVGPCVPPEIAEKVIEITLRRD